MSVGKRGSVEQVHSAIQKAEAVDAEFLRKRNLPDRDSPRVVSQTYVNVLELIEKSATGAIHRQSQQRALRTE
jgi:hypothetical protein